MFDEIEEESEGGADEKNEALESWKTALRTQFEAWLAGLDEIPVPETEDAEPDVYSVYEELTALRNESRRGNRKSAEVFSQFGVSLGEFQGEMKRLREQLIRIESAQAGPAQTLPRSHCLGLVEILDRVYRLGAALERAPRPGRVLSYFSRPWEAAWQSLSHGFSILTAHLEKLLEHSGIRRVETLGQPFDPVSMVAVALVVTSERPAGIVVEQLSAGYRWRDEVLRPAEVKISKPQ
ncbi:MAG: grpE 1 [Chthoniobacteraceae bacterium]|nr:grpE 1 [Chthoniobacteraceae bacterium]